MTAAQIVRAGIIGLGVGEQHIHGYEADPRCRVVTLCDIDPAKLADVGARHPGRRLTTDPADVLGDPQIDVVSIASYDDVHHSQIMAALRSNKHVFVEKPLCLFDEELAEIRAEMVRRPQLRLSSNLILRRSPRFSRLRDQLRAGELGQPYYLEADYNYGRIHKIIEGWRGQLPFYSVMHGGGIHMIDLLLWLLGEKPAKVTAFGNRLATAETAFRHNDCTTALIKFPSGVLAKVTANFSCVFPHYHNLTVYGTTATFVHDQQGARRFVTRDPAEKPLCINDAYLGPAKGDMIPSFVRSIFGEAEPEVSATEVFDAMAVSLAIERAAQTEEPVPISW